MKQYFIFRKMKNKNKKITKFTFLWIVFVIDFNFSYLFFM
jgi:hypothetical protein